jgi:hypothetical protein
MTPTNEIICWVFASDFHSFAGIFAWAFFKDFLGLGHLVENDHNLDGFPGFPAIFNHFGGDPRNTSHRST